MSSFENFVQCRLVTPFAANVTEIGLFDAVAPYRLPPEDGGLVVLTDSPNHPSVFEVIRYEYRNGLALYGVTRGQEGTTAREWIGAAYCYQALMAEDFANALAGKQTKHDNLTAFSDLAGAPDRLPYFAGAGALSLAVLTAKARELLAAETPLAMRVILELVKQTGTTDATVGSLMINGAWGLGAGPISENVNCNNILRTGFYVTAGAALNNPSANGAYILAISNSGLTACVQYAFDVVTGQTFTRKLLNTNWSAWLPTLRAGDYGIGGTTLPAFPGFASAQVGLYIITDIAAISGMPAGATGAYVIFVRRDNHYALFQNNTSATARVFEGVATTSGIAPSVWREVWHSGNLVKQTSPLDSGVNKVLLTGAFGLGSQVVATDLDLDNYKQGGSYITPSSGLLNIPDGWPQARQILTVDGGVSYALQRIRGITNGLTASRVWGGSVWTPWKLDITQGDFGIGTDTAPAVTDLDTTLVSGIYSFGSSPTGNPGFSFGTLIVSGRSPNETTQIAIGVTAEQMAFRVRVSGAWTAWKTVVVRGGYGIGGNAVSPPTGNADTITQTGFYQITSANFGTLPASGGSLIHIERGSSNAATQIFDALVGGGTNRTWIRTRNTSGVWSSSAEVPSLNRANSWLGTQTIQNGSNYVALALIRADQSAAGNTDEVLIDVNTGTGSARFGHLNVDTGVFRRIEITRAGALNFATELGTYKLYYNGNILGAVSQSLGTPTGAIIERGSNANGEYVRYADGTQICISPSISMNSTTAAGNVFQGPETAWTLPATFINSDYSVTGGPIGNALSHWASGKPNTTTEARVIVWSPTSVTARPCRFVAIGRWF